MHYAIMHWLAICARVDCCVIARQNTALSPPCTDCAPRRLRGRSCGWCNEPFCSANYIHNKAADWRLSDGCRWPMVIKHTMPRLHCVAMSDENTFACNGPRIQVVGCGIVQTDRILDQAFVIITLYCLSNWLFWSHFRLLG